MSVARDVGAKMIHMLNLIIVSVEAHMAKPCVGRMNTKVEFAS